MPDSALKSTAPLPIHLPFVHLRCCTVPDSFEVFIPGLRDVRGLQEESEEGIRRCLENSPGLHMGEIA